MRRCNDREVVAEPLGVAVDPHGRYVAVPSRMAQTHLYTRFGRKAGEFETLQPLAHVAFVPGEPRLIGAAGHGSLFGIERTAVLLHDMRLLLTAFYTSLIVWVVGLAVPVTASSRRER